MGSSTLVDEDDRGSEGRRAIAYCFNGVVDARRRRRVLSGDARVRRACCFNGVVDARRRRRVYSWQSSEVARGLQWGRRRSSTKSGALMLDPRGVPAASMGSSTLVDEDSSCGRRGDPRVSGSSMGSSTLVGEDPVAPALDAGAARLQWGRRRSSTKTRRHGARAAAGGGLQWGRRRSSTKTRLPTALAYVDAGVASMGSSTLVDEDAASPRLDPRGPIVLQWGRRRSSTKTRRSGPDAADR